VFSKIPKIANLHLFLSKYSDILQIKTMRLYSTILLIILSISLAVSQQSAEITLKSNKTIPKGYYINIQNKNYSIKQEAIAFQKTIFLETSEYGFLISPKGKLFTFWYEEGAVKLNFEQGMFKNKLIVEGSESHQIYEKLEKTKNFKDYKAAFNENKNSKVAVNHMDRYFKFLNFSQEEFLEIYGLISQENRKMAPNFNAYINILGKDKLIKNRKIIDFVGYDKDGKAFNTEDYRGQYLLIDIAATWCGPCWKALPHILESLENYPNLQFITLNEDNAIERWYDLAIKKNLELDWPVLWEVQSGKRELLLQYEINSYPNYILVNPEGVVVDRWTFSGENFLNAKLKKHLN
jgi:thiol-disulfide isomerase/thioredoxin